ncbi:helix-turn-helix transcriptional regulator [Labrys okinawensis]|uniref:helix-turn-helix transcriptional regulator n=1 Tax=Labrys okinawensis TaxID=346911 RepID=UPI0039BD6232
MMNEALRLIRVFHDMKQAEAAKALGVSASYLSEVEKGKKKATLELIEKYAETYRIPASSILYFSENMGQARAVETTRTAVASKIIKLMQFLETKSERADVD